VTDSCLSGQNLEVTGAQVKEHMTEKYLMISDIQSEMPKCQLYSGACTALLATNLQPLAHVSGLRLAGLS